MPDLIDDKEESSAGLIRIGSKIADEEFTKPSDTAARFPPPKAGGQLFIERGNLDPNFIDEHEYIPLAFRGVQRIESISKPVATVVDPDDYRGLSRSQKRKLRNKKLKAKNFRRNDAYDIQGGFDSRRVWGEQPEIYKNAYSYKVNPHDVTRNARMHASARMTEFYSWSATQKKKANTGPIMEWVKPVLLAVFLAFVLRSFIFEFIYIDGYSMDPTLIDSELIVISKIMNNFISPSFQDIIVCTYPRRDGYYVKRIIGLEGDVISIEDGVLVRNGERIEEEYVNYSSGEDFGPYEVPKGFVFVAGDNREVSIDSRSESVGALASSRVVGEVKAVLFPFGRIKLLE